MIVSTKGRYALRVIIDLAEQNSDSYIPMNQVAERQGISLKYLERILPTLTRNNLIEGIKGKGGGYKLTRKAKEYNVGEILRLIEGNLAPVSCLESSKNICNRANCCKTVKMWSNLNKLINNYLDNITIENLIQNNLKDIAL